MAAPFKPRYKLVITYDIHNRTANAQDAYYRYVLGEFVPALRAMGMHMAVAWHVAYGPYPNRQLDFVCDSLETAQNMFDSVRWEKLEKRLQSYTDNYQRKLVAYREGFQF
jgi:hypothetical protein